jgi:uncharacterized protein (TIRG00374 family)
VDQRSSSPRSATPTFAGGFRRRAALLGIVLSLVSVALVSRQVDVARSWSMLARLDPVLLFLPLAAFAASILLRALRWWTMFPLGAQPGLGRCLTALAIGNGANFLLPGRAGDLARCALVGRGALAEDASRALATLGLEKVLDGLALVAMVLFSLWWIDPPAWVTSLVAVSAAIFGAALVGLVALRHGSARLGSLGRGALTAIGLGRMAQRLEGPLGAFSDGLHAIASTGALLRVLFLTGTIWLVEAALVAGVAVALGSPIRLGAAVVVSAVLGLGLMIPAAPGGLGTYELAGVAAFQLVGVDASSGLTLTLVIHAWVFVTNVALGLALLASSGMRIGQLRRTTATAHSSAAPP